MTSDLFKIERISATDNVFHYRAKIKNNHKIFDGHFPGMPVVPGVCTMSMIKECLAEIFSRSVRYNHIKECKFLSAITPFNHGLLDINLDVKQIDDVININAEVICGAEKMMKLKATII